MSELVSDGHVHHVHPPAQPYLAPPQLVAQPDRFSRFMIRLWQRSPRWAAPALILLCFAGGVGLHGDLATRWTPTRSPARPAS